MTITSEMASPDEPEFPLRLSFRAGALVCSEVLPSARGRHTNYLADCRLSSFDVNSWEEFSERTRSESTDPVRVGQILGALASLSEFYRPDMTDEAIAASVAVSSDELLTRIDDLLAEPWTLSEGTAYMHPSQAPADENWRL
jgi:hypothetical protein